MDFTRFVAFPTLKAFGCEGIKSPLNKIDVPVDDSIAAPMCKEPVPTYIFFQMAPVEPSEYILFVAGTRSPAIVTTGPVEPCV